MSEYYVPGSEEKDPKKVIYSLQQAHEKTATNTDDIATNTADIATNTANIATNTANIATNTSNIASNTSAIAALAGLRLPDVILEDRKSSGTHGGGATAGSPPTRDLNTIVRNAGTVASLSSNQFTLVAGTYFIAWSAPAWRVDQHQTILRNVTDSSNVGVGTSEYSASATDNAQSRSFGAVATTIASSKAFIIQHAVVTTRATTGYGVAGSFGIGEVYTRVEITKYG